MRSLTLAAIVLAASLAMPVAADGPVSADPAVREADRQRVIELNTAQARHVRARDRGRAQSPSRASQSRYNAAQAQYQADMAAWRRQVAACRGGDWSQCER